MKEKLKNSKGITLIALVITIILLLIIAVIVINITLGNNGIVNRANEAVILQKKGQYFEEIQLEIVEEQMERILQTKNERFIESLEKRLEGTQSASAQTTKSYPKKPWVDNAEICLPNAIKNLLVVYTVEGYQIVIDVDNENNIATIREGSFVKPEECTISFNGNGASGSVASITTSKGLSIELPVNGFTKAGYAFAGWFEDEECETDRYNPGEAYPVSGDKTLYAKWSENIATITYNAGGGTGTQMNNTVIEIGQKDNLLLNTYIKDGYTFSGWKDQDNLTYTDGQEITATKNLNLTAQWNLQEYTISYELDGGTVTSANPTTYTIETASFTLNNPQKDGLIFKGWSGTDLEGNENTLVTISQGSTGTRTYTANYVKTATVKLKNAEEKIAITSSNIASYIGAEVDYNPTGGGTWRIFYLDTTGKYGDGENTLFIKRDYNDGTTFSDSDQKNYSTNDTIKSWLVKFNPEWATKNNINQVNERLSAYLCYKDNWTQYVSTSGENKANYAIGSPSIELYMDAYNQWGGYDSGKGPLSYRYNSWRYGYQPGKDGSFSTSIDYLPSGSINYGPSSIFGSGRWWLASPHTNVDGSVCYVNGNNGEISYAFNYTLGLCPVVSLQ